MDPIVESIKERKEMNAQRIPGVMKEIMERFEPLRPGFDAKLKEVVEASSSRRAKIFKIQKLTSEVRDTAASYSVCQKGCSNCCYQRVMISQTEADTIAHNIGRRTVQLSPTYKLPDTDAYSRETPCTFLADGACSIYEHRPFMCRNQVNLDVDNLLCSFENWELGKQKSPLFTGVPMLGPGPLLDAYQKISGADKYGDIRDFFPPSE